jgi:hypothetical protein
MLAAFLARFCRETHSGLNPGPKGRQKIAPGVRSCQKIGFCKITTLCFNHLQPKKPRDFEFLTAPEPGVMMPEWKSPEGAAQNSAGTTACAAPAALVSALSLSRPDGRAYSLAALRASPGSSFQPLDNPSHPGLCSAALSRLESPAHRVARQKLARRCYSVEPPDGRRKRRKCVRLFIGSASKRRI